MGRSFRSQISNGFVPQKTKKADMAKHPKVSGHVGLLVNEPPGKPGCSSSSQPANFCPL